jgi:hypothetical protein
MSLKSDKKSTKSASEKRLFTENDIDSVLLNLFRLYDDNADNKFSKK